MWSMARPGVATTTSTPRSSCLELTVDRLAAVDRDDLHAQVTAVLEDRLADLHRELTGRNEHERRRCGAAAARRLEPVEDRQRERRGLAGAGRRLAEQVATGEQGGIASRWIGVGSS